MLTACFRSQPKSPAKGSLPVLRVVLLTALLAAPAGADTILDWNEVALARVVAAGELPPEAARAMAMVHVAMFDAVAAVDHRFEPYAYRGDAPGGASAEVAAAAAAHAILVDLYPEQRAAVDAALTAALAANPDGKARAGGTAVGEAAAAACRARRAADGAATVETYRPRTAPGVYVPTTVPVSSQWPGVATWLLGDDHPLRPAAPPDLTSELWARDYAEVKTLGARASAARSPAQTEAARFWIVTGPAAWNPVVRSLAASRTTTLLDNARLFALTAVAAADAFQAVFDAKYAYGFWRPITAVRNGDQDGNPATERDAGWLPLVDTPMHPEYPCAHCITAGAVAAVLESEFGQGPVAPIEMTSATAPGVVHRWTRIADYVAEVNGARIWGGIHYRNSTAVGEAMGRRIGTLAVAGVMRRRAAEAR